MVPVLKQQIGSMGWGGTDTGEKQESSAGALSRELRRARVEGGFWEEMNIWSPEGFLGSSPGTPVSGPGERAVH